MAGKIILYIATSLDGFIARKNGNIDWLTKYDGSKEDYGYKALLKSVDAIIFGGKTYRQVEKDIKEMYKEKELYVFSKKKYKSELKNIHFVNDDIKKVIKKIKLKSKKDIWLVGGAELANQFIKEDLIDEYIITVVPIILGDGIRLFQEKNFETNLKLMNAKKFKSGLVMMSYVRKK